MKRIVLFTIMLFGFCSFGAARNFSQMFGQQNYETPSATAIISAAQTVTASWAAIGSQQSTGGYSKAALYFDLDINDSANARVRAIVRHTTGGNTYLLPIKTVGTSEVKVEPEYYEFNVDEDRKMVLTWDLDRVIPYLSFEVSVSSTGTTAAKISNAHLIKRWK